MGRRGGVEGNCPAFQIIPDKQCGPHPPFPFVDPPKMCVCGGWHAAAQGDLIFAQQLSLIRNHPEYKDSQMKIPLRPLTRFPSRLHNLLELIS